MSIYLKMPCKTNLLETNGNGGNDNAAKSLKPKAGDRDRTGDVQLGKLNID